MRHQRSPSGLTLTELLVAASIASIVAGSMVTVLSLTAGRTHTGNQVAALDEDLKQALDLVSNEAQGASRLYRANELTGVSVTGTTAGYRPIMGFFVPKLDDLDPALAVENDYYFRLLYLDSPPTDTTGYQYKGPGLLYLSGDTTVYFGTATDAPAPPATAVAMGAVLSDYLTENTTFVLDGTRTGVLSLQGILQVNAPDPNNPCPAPPAAVPNAQCLLTLKTRITARN